MTAAQYIGRRFDVLAFRGSDRSVGAASQTLFDGANGGEVCTGPQKLAQRWALEFLTVRGSMGFHLSSRGTDFMRWARQGLIRTEFDVRSYFNFAAQQARINLLNEELDDTPDDERLDRADLQQISLLVDGLELAAAVRSLAGESRQVILPISIVPANLTL